MSQRKVYGLIFTQNMQTPCISLCMLHFCLFFVKGLKRRRASTLTAIEFTEKKFLKKAELKEKELVLRRVELELQQKKIEAEEEERKQRLQLEMEERRAIIEMLNRR